MTSKTCKATCKALIIMVLLFVVSVSEAADSITIDFGYALAEDTPTGRSAARFAEVLAEKSGGAMKVNIYPSSQVGSEREMQEGCQLGTLDMCIGSTATLSNFDRIWQIYDIPFVIQDYNEAYKSDDSANAKKRLDSLAKLNIKGLAIIDPGFVEILNNKRELKVPDDLKGMNIRCMEAAGYISTLKTLGANPVQSATSEIYNMLQNGTVDGTSNPVGTIYTFSLYEIGKYLSIMHTWYTPVVMAMSMKTWNSLNQEQQGWVIEAAEAAKLHGREVRQQMEKDWTERMKKAGMVVTTYSLEERKVWSDFAEKNLYPQFVPSIIPQSEWDEFLAARGR
ncbi:C4-dicarboxylate-binding protein DctB [Synergistales bacterium]|nr:C4-dicarboxylate-binding protein DctB [Synergistales bacterium]